MATQLQLRKGTKIQNDTFTGAQGELTFETDTKGLRIHDGATQGGFEVPVLVAIQRPTAANDYTWYRKYSDGWVEQGGRIGLNTTSVAIPVEMSDADYQCIVTYRNMSGNTNTLKFENAATLTQTSTGFTVLTAASSYRNWFVQGMAA